MKTVVLLFISVVIFGCQPKQDSLSTDIIDNPVTANENSDSLNAPVMTFDDEVFDFGEIVFLYNKYMIFKLFLKVDNFL